jgi:hypothetical protein
MSLNREFSLCPADNIIYRTTDIKIADDNGHTDFARLVQDNLIDWTEPQLASAVPSQEDDTQVCDDDPDDVDEDQEDAIAGGMELEEDAVASQTTLSGTSHTCHAIETCC